MPDETRENEATEWGSAEGTGTFITVTHVLEHLFCPRFTYFEHVLGIPERQERRTKVQKGREVHEERRKVNPNYLRKKLGVVARRQEVPLASERVAVSGVVDEVLTLNDGTMAPFDYKFAEDKGRVFHNQKIQSVLYGMLIEDVFGVSVRRGYLCYTRTKHRVRVIDHTEQDRTEASRVVREILDVIQTGYLPEATPWKARCTDCCYRNICIQ